jgi:hypothetical protein
MKKGEGPLNQASLSRGPPCSNQGVDSPENQGAYERQRAGGVSPLRATKNTGLNAPNSRENRPDSTIFVIQNRVLTVEKVGAG